ncbi:sporulation histidine kinase inhibitor Sda [Halalkalibacter urbisdiaboli]|nr:sporulation histidine kinase inhibitor Sda [Halalkalibacter urbisdiaboli]
MFEQLSDRMLIQAYNKAIELKLEQDFIDMLKKAIKKRNLFKA